MNTVLDIRQQIFGNFSETILTGRNDDGMTRRGTDNVQQATEADWLTIARDFTCAEPSKTRPPPSVAVIFVFIDPISK
jgi:hypothetical protein